MRFLARDHHPTAEAAISLLALDQLLWWLDPTD
jgi:hypothetical protein